MKKSGHEHFKTKLGFIAAAAGSAIGLANIWRFPYLVAQNGGAVFIFTYIIFLFLLGIPILITEISIGRHGQTSVDGALYKVTHKKTWKQIGKIEILTGFLISSFYSVVAGWILGYLVESFLGNVSHQESFQSAEAQFQGFLGTPTWVLSYHLIFIVLCAYVLLGGVKKGIEWVSKSLIPLLFLLFVFLIIMGLANLDDPKQLDFLFTPDWSKLTPRTLLLALGQAFFTLSLGQGTMITYGGYLKKKENVVGSCVYIAGFDLLAAILSILTIFSIAGVNEALTHSGPGLIFSVLPVAFSRIVGGNLFAILFFVLVAIAALTSQISAMEPLICYLQEQKKWTRKASTWFCALGAFIVGIPSALSFSLFKHVTLFNQTFFDLLSFITLNCMVPLGGLVACILAGYVWGPKNVLKELEMHMHLSPTAQKLYAIYFKAIWKFIAPVLIIFILLDAFNVF